MQAVRLFQITSLTLPVLSVVNLILSKNSGSFSFDLCVIKKVTLKVCEFFPQLDLSVVFDLLDCQSGEVG